MLLLKETERELQRLNMEEACGRGGEGVRAMEHEAQESTDSALPQLKGQKQKRMGSSEVYHIFSVLYCSILMCYTPLMEEKFYKECIRTIHWSMKTALQISNRSWLSFICNCKNPQCKTLEIFYQDKTGNAGRPHGGEAHPHPSRAPQPLLCLMPAGATLISPTSSTVPVTWMRISCLKTTGQWNRAPGKQGC